MYGGQNNNFDGSKCKCVALLYASHAVASLLDDIGSEGRRREHFDQDRGFDRDQGLGRDQGMGGDPNFSGGQGGQGFDQGFRGQGQGFGDQGLQGQGQGFDDQSFQGQGGGFQDPSYQSGGGYGGQGNLGGGRNDQFGGPGGKAGKPSLTQRIEGMCNQWSRQQLLIDNYTG